MKKEQRFMEMQLSQLRAENQRIEAENVKQHRRIDKIMGSNIGGQSANDVRKEIEKSVLVRQLKAQINSLRIVISDKDIEIQDLKKNMRSTVASELMAEKEEYFLEIIRLRKTLQDKMDALKAERQNREWEKAIATGTEGPYCILLSRPIALTLSSL